MIKIRKTMHTTSFTLFCCSSDNVIITWMIGLDSRKSVCVHNIESGPKLEEHYYQLYC